MNLGSLANKNPEPASGLDKRTIEIVQTPACHPSKHRAEVRSGSQLERNAERVKTHELLTNIIGAHRISPRDPVTDYRLHHHHLSTGNFDLVNVRWQGGFELEQDPLDARYLIYVVLAGSLDQKIDSPQESLRQRHQTFCCSPATATIISPGQKLKSIASEEGEALLIAIESRSIDSAVGKLLARLLKQPVIFIASIDLTCDLGLSLKKFLQFLWDSAAGVGTVSPPASFVLIELEQAFLACAIKGLPSNYSEELLYQHDGALACHVRKARAFIESHLHEDIKLGDIAAAAGVCDRLLQKAFSEHCGCSPMRFVTQERLQRVRQELDRSTTDTKIVNVMMDYGFTQGGKFAREYQQLFGEKPSETLKRSSQFNRADSLLWQQIDDARSEQVVGGRSISSSQTLFTAECLRSPQTWQTISCGLF